MPSVGSARPAKPVPRKEKALDAFVLTYSALNGLLIGGMYGGIALGLSLIFGVMRIVNFAHGSFLMLAMYIAFWGQKLGGLDPYVSAVIAVPLMFYLGYFIQATIIAPLIKRERALVVEPISALLLTAGVYIVLDNLALMAFGANVQMVESSIKQTTIPVGDFPLNTFRVIGCLSSIAITGILALWLKFSETGRAIRATAQNRDGAALSGINVNKIYNTTFGLGCGIVGAMGCLLAPFIPLTPSVGLSFGIKSFIVVVLGGIGSIAGSLIGGLVIGLFESVTAQFVTTPTASIFTLALFIIILLVRPQGLMGKK